MKTALPKSQQSLIQWVSQATGISTLGVKVRLRGNDLYILCESQECPQRWRTLSDLLHALQHTNLDALTSSEQPSIYQVFVYGRKKGEHKPRWCHQVFLNQLDRHLEQVERALLEDAEKSHQTGGALVLSNESLARQGNPDAIARYLSETLSSLGVAVEVKVKQQQATTLQNPIAKNRLWIYCQSSYIPDPSLIAEPVAKKLRGLQLCGYEDAVLATTITGETGFGWLLRIDLTPTEVMLKEWARWGDVQAIARLLNEKLSDFHLHVSITLKESTLHIFCSSTNVSLTAPQVPNKALCLKLIMSELEIIAPQGILAATIYGHATADKQPDWIDWRSLPATVHPALAIPVLELAASGDEPALVFLLERMLNPDLDLRLKTGGIRVLLLKKGDLLHVMCDAPVCPTRKRVAEKVTRFLWQLKIPNLGGVRVYGRRAGNKEPLWHYGVDFVNRQRLVPEATPEFAATAAYVGDLMPSEPSESVLRPDLNTEEVQNIFAEFAAYWGAKFRQWLLATQLLTETNQQQQLKLGADEAADRRIALIWGLLGLLLTIQADWMLGVIADRFVPPTPKIASTAVSSFPSTVNSFKPSPSTVFFTNTSKQKSPGTERIFNASGFTRLEDAKPRQKATATAILLAARSGFPTFNARQLDEQLALYRQRLSRTGKPPDVLIIGSSRALRGIDPSALSKALATRGYPNVDVFNFGINGATAQVVDFILRYVLEASELPKLILWADGARAFNSSREDITFNAIAASPGYQKVMQKQLAKNSHLANTNTSSSSLIQKTAKSNTESNTYRFFDNWLNQALASFSQTYSKRDQLKNLLNQNLKSLPLMKDKYTGKKDLTATQQDVFEQAVDFDGFLPLSIRFQPSTYYQNHPKVSGNYDSDYADFQLKGKQETALQSLLQFTEARKINLVFINMPLTAEYLDPVRQKYEQEFQQYMLNLARTSNLIYRDFSLLWPKANDYFSDPSHLNRYGAYQVSQKLAIDPMIPWPAK
jgi:hypothetical protein